MEGCVNVGKYGQAADEAVELIEKKLESNPINAWEVATINIYGAGSSSQAKGCPRDAFLGLCEEGLVKGVPDALYCRSKKNKAYAIKAVELLKKEPKYAYDMNNLWDKVTGGAKIHNSQMDVVIQLWENGKIV